MCLLLTFQSYGNDKVMRLLRIIKNFKILYTKVGNFITVSHRYWKTFQGYEWMSEKSFPSYNSNKYQRTGHELASKTIPQRDAVFDNTMSVFSNPSFWLTVSSLWNTSKSLLEHVISPSSICMHLYEHIICPTPRTLSPCIFLMNCFILVNLGYFDGLRIGGLLWRGVMDQ